MCSVASYGYLQIDSYAKKKHIEKELGTKAGPIRWVEVPSTMQVRGFLEAGDSYGKSNLSSTNEKLPKSLCKSNRLSTYSTGSLSTAASESEEKGRVRFSDGSTPCTDVQHCTDLEVDRLAEWIYIDRDMCGFSLYEYMPDHADFGEFASSKYGKDFAEEYKNLSRCNRRQQKELMTCAAYKEAYAQQESELDEKLSRAGVDEQWLHA
jgi:hypothetical protein